MKIQKRFVNLEKVIKLEDVSLQFMMPNQQNRTARDIIINRIRKKRKQNYFTALKNVSFEVHKGEVLGLIGHNGAGKSTLLRVVARILRPTEGRVYVKGNIAPLFGVGAGFHNELSGRENVFLSGSILGFTHEEMKEKFDRIVKFSEIGEFIDSPVRTYSSGMRARLGFAIATDATPDILIIDEVLSVGDENFRVKSRKRMKSFFDQGATILVVSHSMATILELCNRVVWMHKGRVKMIDRTRVVVDAYRGSRKK